MAGKVEARVLQEILVHEIECDKQAANSPVAVEEGVDGFELVVADCDAYQLGDLNGFVVPERFEVSEEIGELIAMWFERTIVSTGCSLASYFALSSYEGRSR